MKSPYWGAPWAARAMSRPEHDTTSPAAKAAASAAAAAVSAISAKKDDLSAVVGAPNDSSGIGDAVNRAVLQAALARGVPADGAISAAAAAARVAESSPSTFHIGPHQRQQLDVTIGTMQQNPTPPTGTDSRVRYFSEE